MASSTSPASTRSSVTPSEDIAVCRLRLAAMRARNSGSWGSKAGISNHRWRVGFEGRYPVSALFAQRPGDRGTDHLHRMRAVPFRRAEQAGDLAALPVEDDARRQADGIEFARKSSARVYQQRQIAQ